MSFLAMAYNYQLLHLAGEAGVAAFGVIMYISFVYESAYLGYAQGIAPVISFNYGAQNRKELHNVFTKSLVFYGMTGLVVTLASLAFASPLAWLFTGYNQSLYTLTIHGLRLYALSFTISGFPIFADSFFTALNNGPVAAVISVCPFYLNLLRFLYCPLFWGWMASGFLSMQLMWPRFSLQSGSGNKISPNMDIKENHVTIDIIN